ncbi:MAG: PorT family protein [Bacteroidetes bacterium]|nr:PorT family protein [Bacteroidota bacterium]
MKSSNDRKLRNGVLALGLGMLLATSVKAQEPQAAGEPVPTAKFGIKGGVNLTNLYVDNVKDENMKVGFNAGLYAKVPLSRVVSIQPELLYSQKGAKLTYDNVFGSGEYRFNLNYVEVPVSAVFNVAKNLNLHVGGYASYLANANVKRMNDNGEASTIADLNEDNFHRFDYGLLGGVGVDVQNFTIGARYNYGLHEIGKSGSLSGNVTSNSKNSAINLFIGFGF